MAAFFDLKKQRDTLEQLRREVQALDEVTERGLPLPLASETSEKSSGRLPRRSFVEKAETTSSRLEERLEASIAELEGQLGSVGSECEAARVEVSRREAIQAQAKAAWSRALSHAAAAEGREERRFHAAKKEYDEMHSQELQLEAAHHMERDRLRQRHRNLRMQLRQAEQQYAQTAREEAMGCEYRQDRDSVVYNSAEDLNISPAAASTAVPRSCSRERVSPRTSRQGKQVVAAKLISARRELDATHDAIAHLRQRQEALLEGKRELSERESGLRKASRLTDREVENLRRRSELRHEEASLREEQHTLRQELKDVASEVETAQREAARQRNNQERVAQELNDREIQFREQESATVQALDTIQEYLCSNGGLSLEERQVHLADWLESDISTRQVERVKRRLSEIVADAGARAQVLEQAVSELHADLDRRAAIILELVERRNACTEDDRVAESNKAGKAVVDSLGIVGYGSSSEEEEEPRTNASSPGDDQHDDKPACNGEQKTVGQLDRRALEDELEHQRGLFELRGEQVQGLEQRLAALLAREAPRVYALRAWVAVHDALSRDRLQSCLRAVASNNALRADVEAMQRDKSLHLAEAEAEWSAQRYHLSEAANGARQYADEAAACAAGIQKRRQGLLKGLDRLLKAEAKLSAKVSTASEAVDRDQRRLVDLTARQIRASSSMSRQREQSGVKFDRSQRSEAARQALHDARDLVESTRAQQAEVLLGLVQENIHVTVELRRVDEALEQALLKEERAKYEIAELEDDGSEGVAMAATSPLRRGTSSPRRETSRGTAPSSHRGTSTGRIQLERKKTRLEEDLHSTVEQLRRGEIKFEEIEKSRKDMQEKSEMKMTEMQEEFESEKARQRASVATLLKRYRGTQASYTEAEQALGELCARSDAISKEMADARLALRRDRERRQKRPQSEGRKLAGNGTSAGHLNGISEAQTAKARSNAAAKISEPEAHGGKSPRNIKKDANIVVSRPVPSVLEIRQRKDLEGHPDIQSFYLQVFPLLKGTNLEVFRKSRQRFETRQLVLSSDLQRFELWPTSTPSSSSSNVAAPLAGVSGPTSGSVTPPPSGSSRISSRLPESFIRVEGIARVHVPKTTLAAVQRAILSSTQSGKDFLAASISEPSWKDAVSLIEEMSHTRNAAQQDLDAHSIGISVGGSLESAPSTSVGAGIDGVESNGGVNCHAFPFDVVMTSADPWRFMAADVHTFHLATAAISAILTSRASLQSFAVALSLGGISQQLQGTT